MASAQHPHPHHPTGSSIKVNEATGQRGDASMARKIEISKIRGFEGGNQMIISLSNGNVPALFAQIGDVLCKKLKYNE